MALSASKKTEYTIRLQKARLRVLCNHGFYGLLLMHMGFALDESCETAATNGERIIFGPAFLEKISDSELDFVLMHEILHVVLQHCFRYGERDREAFNVACDIVVNSNILLSFDMDLSTITIEEFGEPAMHIAPNGKEGCEYTAEQVYEQLPKLKGGPGKSVMDCSGNSFRDDHSRWGTVKDPDFSREAWVRHFVDACEAIEIRDPGNQCGSLPLFAKRLYDALKEPQTDWRTILDTFVQEEVIDYSFFPPDRRYDGSPFFLPDLNEKEEKPQDILFMVDTSGSVSDDMLVTAISEIKGAIEQFDGKLKGWLGYFDMDIIEPLPFSNVNEMLEIKPAGGGGTSFHVIFSYVNEFMSDNPPSSIVILTDGYADFPPESMAEGIPVLWLINNNEITPPWGKVARIHL